MDALTMATTAATPLAVAVTITHTLPSVDTRSPVSVATKPGTPAKMMMKADHQTP
jgi:hypothetical protein